MIWGGVDLLATNPLAHRNGATGLAQLAVRILSVVPNSAGCERIFSIFGNIHTKIRNRLHPPLVHKSGLARLYLQRDHAAQGILVDAQKRRKFGQELSYTNTNKNPTHQIDPVVPAVVEFQDIVDAIASDVAAANQTADETGAPTDRIDVPLASADSADATNSSRTERTSIPLSHLFTFPGDSGHSLGRPMATVTSALQFYWKGGIRNLDMELRHCDLLHDSH